MSKRKLVLENGLVFIGEGFGSDKEAVAELIFNTSVVGYQEILSDPVNYNKIICMTYPVIGSYGLTDEDYESNGLKVSGLVVREYNDIPSNFRYTHTLDEIMVEDNVVGISGVDTRQITRIIRDSGTMRAIICDIEKPINECLVKLSEGGLDDLVSGVSTKKVVYSRTANPTYTVVALDLGIRKSVIRSLNKLGCNVILVPHTTSCEAILKYKADGLLISDGPGIPACNVKAIELVKALKGKMPILGIGAGQAVIALAYGADTYKEKVGHNGCNIPVRCLETGKITITSIASLYGVSKDSLAKTDLKLTHVNVIDDTVMGLKNEDDKVLAVGYQLALNKDEANTYNEFIDLLKKSRGEQNAKKNRY